MPRLRTDRHLVHGFPPRPANLGLKASVHWDRIATELNSAGIQLSPAHRATLEIAAVTAADMDDARETVEVEGAYIEQKAGLTMHPAARRLDALRRDYIKVLGMLGIRAAVASPPESDRESLEELLG